MPEERELAFGERVTRALEDAVIKLVKDGGFVQPDYANRLKVDPSLVRSTWEAVDRRRIIETLTSHIEGRVADAILNNMATEIATDVKKVLSDQELRADIRALIRQRIRVAEAAIVEGS